MRHPLMRKDESTDTESGPFSQVHQAPSLPLVSMCAACETGTVKPHSHVICCRKFGCFLDPLCLHWLALRTGLRIRDVYPGSWFFSSRISDSGSNNSNKRERGKICFLPFFVATNIIKLNFWTGKEKNLSQNTKNFNTLVPFSFFTYLVFLVMICVISEGFAGKEWCIWCWGVCPGQGWPSAGLSTHTVKWGKSEHLKFFKVVLKLFCDGFSPFFLQKSLYQKFYFLFQDLTDRF